jgi:uncharacterized protein involved in exopolysaccharide biosynthesis
MNQQPDPSIVSFSMKPWLHGGRFVLGTLRRRWILVLLLPVLFTSAAVAAARVLPRVYTTETRLLTKKNYTMPALAAPGRSVPLGSEAPAQSAAELVLQRDALEQIVERAGLAASWSEKAPPLMRAKQALRTRIKGPLSEEEMQDAMVGLLRQRVRVRIDDSEVITIRASWWNADDALAIVNEALTAFLASRQRLDVETIAETEAILARNTDALQARVEQRLATFRDARARAVGGTAALIAKSRDTPAELEKLRTELNARQRYRQELERQRDLRIGQLQMQVAEQSATLGERHPDQVATREALNRVLADDGGVTQARVQEEQLEREFSARGGSASGLRTMAGSDLIDAASSPDDDASVIYARALLRIDVDDYQDMSSRLSNARIELETARAAFGYRYMVTQPAERPREADSPNPLLMAIGGLFAGVFAGMAAALALELRGHVALLVREQLAA